MKIGLFPCQGKCNVSNMTKMVAQLVGDEEGIHIMSNLYVPIEIEENNKDVDKFELKYISLNGCPAKCATKAFETSELDPDIEVTITKDFDPKNNEKYEVIICLDEEMAMVKEAIDIIKVNNKTEND